ncbi:hypothetical protein FQJ98_04060 [Xanthomonas vasicola]|nr:hypothetical protein FQK00_07420 [Xanthomonas vasicola]TWQ38584.1 hypothetical protein FQJ99_03020 [Xanthomonas vasicola]TWQ47197.1 hypothetical protein FQJ98_04060 [Xanthomonas vasicola]TWQ77243.1 hypothetical protein FQJ86_07420 [Xanthomonas vasicola]TWR11982.1 hypothetical protein FQJ84_03500 [Xanthomonas vasicola]
MIGSVMRGIGWCDKHIGQCSHAKGLQLPPQLRSGIGLGRHAFPAQQALGQQASGDGIARCRGAFE